MVNRYSFEKDKAEKRRYRQGVREAKRHEIMVDPRWLRVREKPRHEIMDNRL